LVISKKGALNVKTYSHLLKKRRIPTEYELVCSRLLYYPAKGGFEVNTPLAKWYDLYQKGSPLKCKDWEGFYDPRETTYSKYINLQKTKEIFVDGILEFIETEGYDKRISEKWLNLLAQLVFPFRYPGHGFQMIASYIGQMAPSGRITITCALQAADELRRCQRIAYRMAQVQIAHDFSQRDMDRKSKDLWENDPLWQPFRESIERLLVTYDWAEALVALNLVLKPMIDDLFMVQLGQLAEKEGDPLLREFFFSFSEDCQWHQEWSRALIGIAIKDNSTNLPVIHRWITQWYPLAHRAVSSFDLIFSRSGLSIRVPEIEKIMSDIDETLAA
jgi:toluene monooxygenase system protein E